MRRTYTCNIGIHIFGAHDEDVKKMTDMLDQMGYTGKGARYGAHWLVTNWEAKNGTYEFVTSGAKTDGGRRLLFKGDFYLIQHLAAMSEPGFWPGEIVTDGITNYLVIPGEPVGVMGFVNVFNFSTKLKHYIVPEVLYKLSMYDVQDFLREGGPRALIENPVVSGDLAPAETPAPKPLFEIWRNKDHCRKVFEMLDGSEKIGNPPNKLLKVFHRKKAGRITFYGTGNTWFTILADGQVEWRWSNCSIFELVDLIRGLGYEPEIKK